MHHYKIDYLRSCVTIRNNFKKKLLLFLKTNKEVSNLEIEIARITEKIISLNDYLEISTSLHVIVTDNVYEEINKLDKTLITKRKLLEKKTKELTATDGICTFLVKNFRYALYYLCLDERINIIDLCDKTKIPDTKILEDFCFSDNSLKKETYLKILDYFGLEEYYLFWINDCFELTLEEKMKPTYSSSIYS